MLAMWHIMNRNRTMLHCKNNYYVFDIANCSCDHVISFNCFACHPLIKLLIAAGS